MLQRGSNQALEWKWERSDVNPDFCRALSQQEYLSIVHDHGNQVIGCSVLARERQWLTTGRERITRAPLLRVRIVVDKKCIDLSDLRGKVKRPIKRGHCLAAHCLRNADRIGPNASGTCSERGDLRTCTDAGARQRLK